MSSIIEMCGITKEFPGVLANDGVNLSFERGEIHALLGENGAGKSTLVSILFGLYKADKGVIKKNGEVVEINGPNDANALGIGMVHQHFRLVHNFTVLENIILGVETVRYGVLKLENARAKVTDLINRYKLHVDLDALISDITVGMQQRVEILKMLYRDNEILIFDEPTAMLTPQEIEEFMQILRNMAAEGKSILFITHKLAEIKAVARRCTVLCRGKYVGTVSVADAKKEDLSEMMVGRKVSLRVEKPPCKHGAVVLDVKNVTVREKTHSKPIVNNVSFEVRAGEIVAIAGIDGNGQRELIYAITGLQKMEAGSITLGGAAIESKSVRERAKAGLAYVPEDRHKHGLVLDYTLSQNLVLQNYWTPRFQQNGFLKFDEIDNYAQGLVTQFDIRSGKGAATVTRSMSGGNQQKAIIARELDRNTPCLIACQPTRGLDVGAIEYIHRQIVDCRQRGAAVLMVSMELDEVLLVSDRILVIYEGEIVANIDAKNAEYKELGLYMSGGKRGV